MNKGTINSGVYEGTIVSRGNLLIKGGTFTSSGKMLYATFIGEIEIQGGTFKGSDGILSEDNISRIYIYDGYFELTDGAWCCARPSGTEPKIKFYMGVKGNSLADAEVQVEALTDAVKALV